MRHLVTKNPWLARFLLKILLRNADYFRCIETGFGLADGTFELLRLESALIRETNIEVGRSNYHLLFEMAATDQKP
jgi:hypothetical protein